MRKYRVCGAFNAFDVWPGFLQPIFTDGDKLFFQLHANGKIKGFEECLTESVIRDRLIPLDVKDEFEIGSSTFNAVGFSINDIVTGSNDDIIMDFNLNQDKYLSDKDFSADMKYFLIKYGV